MKVNLQIQQRKCNVKWKCECIWRRLGAQFVALQLDKTVFRSAQAITVVALPLPRLIDTKQQKISQNKSVMTLLQAVTFAYYMSIRQSSELSNTTWPTFAKEVYCSRNHHFCTLYWIVECQAVVLLLVVFIVFWKWKWDKHLHEKSM